jgi:uncharacterized paraquat-inducible protein A
MFLVVAFILWVLCGLGAGMVAQTRSANGCLWFALGVLFGPLGLALAFASGSDRHCPYCKELVHPEALRCPRCQADIGSMASDEADDDPASEEPDDSLVEDIPVSSPLNEVSANASVVGDQSGSRYCNHCGGAVPHTAKFCNDCGSQIIRAVGEAHA